MWLRDSLPRDLPGAQVMIWGYNTTISGSESFQNIHDIAMRFKADLWCLSEDLMKKPFIILAHSLGGLILKLVSSPGTDMKRFLIGY